MTTSPFGSPVAPEPEPSAGSAAAAPSASRRKPVLIAVGGVLAVAAVGAGAFFLLGGDDPADVEATPVPRGQGVSPEPTETEALPADPEETVTLSSRNPFAAQVGAGADNAVATAPEAVAPSSSGSSDGSSSGSSGGSSGGSSSAAPAPAAGADGANGADGKDGAAGKNGADGKDGADGVSPDWVTLTLRDVVDDATATPKGTFTVRDDAGEVTTANVAAADPVAEFGVTTPLVISVVSYEDLDTDGEMDYVVVQVGEAGAQYSVWIGEALPLFGY